MQQRSVLLSLLLILLPVALFAQNDSTPKFFLGYSNLQAEGLPNKNNPNNVLSPEFIDRRSTLHGFNAEATFPIRNFGITGDFSFERVVSTDTVPAPRIKIAATNVRLSIGSVLTLVGTYGVLSLSVAARRRELAIRAAVGAQRHEIRNMIMGDGLRLIASGVAAGLLAAIVFSRVLRTFLFGVEPTDPLTLIGVGIAFAAVAMLSCWAPARRATKVDPAEALRYE